MEDFREWLTDFTASLHHVPERIIGSLAVIAILLLIRWAVIRLLERRWEDVRLMYHVRKATAYTGAGIGMVILGFIWLPAFRNIGTVVGLMSAGIAVALGDVIASLAGWIYLLWRHPFEVGDRIQIGEHRGDVIDIQVLRFTVMEIGNWVEADQSTGRVIHIPNSILLKQPVANYSRGFDYIWNEVVIRLTFESNWKKAKEILQEVADEHSLALTESARESVKKAAREAMVLVNVLTPKVWTSIIENGVRLTVRYLCHPQARRGSEEALCETILTRLAEHDDIEFAYQTTRWFQRPTEGGGRMMYRPKEPDPSDPNAG